ncbi:MAG TPA: hypothetical protein VKR06_10580 [Ktedonosporobacter sp.]|nr:hypothetical protein [Ktedonosporobacter sp.]
MLQPLLLLILVLVICGGVYGYLTYRSTAERRAREKKRSQYHDRV